MADFIFYHNPSMNYQSLMELHASSMNVFSDLSQYNATTGDLSGTCNKHIEVTPEAVQNYINVAGYASDGYLKNQVEEFVPSYLGNLNQQQRQSFCKTTTQVLQKLAKESYPSHVGSVTFFDWGTPRIYLFNNKKDTESANTDTLSHNKHSVDRINEEEDTNSPLSTSVDRLASQRRLLRQQVQIDDNNSHSDDDDLQVKPTSPSPNDNDNSLRQAINQQQQAIDDDDDENYNKKKRDRRLQRQRRTKQRLTQEQQEEARIIRERCLADEAKRNAELKHPHPKPGSYNKPSSNSRNKEADDGLGR